MHHWHLNLYVRKKEKPVRDKLAFLSPPNQALNRQAQHGSRVVEKKLPAADLKRPLVEPEHPHLTIRRQYEPLGLNRSSYCLTPTTASAEDPRLMPLIDQQFL
jgi:hypothetical protein